MENPFEGTIFGAAKKAFDFGLKVAAKQKEKKESQCEEISEDDYEEEEVSTKKSKKVKGHKASAAAGKKLGKGLKSLWDMAGAH